MQQPKQTQARSIKNPQDEFVEQDVVIPENVGPLIANNGFTTIIP